MKYLIGCNYYDLGMRYTVSVNSDFCLEFTLRWP